MSTYTVQLTIGGHSFTITKGDPPAWPNPDVLDQLILSWDTPDDAIWPAQPNPTQLQLSLLAHAAADLADIAIGTPVTMQLHTGLFSPNDDPPSPMQWARFVGKVSDLNGKPIKVPVGEDTVPGWQLALTAADVRADLAEYTIAGQGNGAASLTPLIWIADYFDAAGLVEPDFAGGDGYDFLAAINYADIPVTPLNEATESMLAIHADGGNVTGDFSNRDNYDLYASQGWRRGMIVPITDAWLANPDADPTSEQLYAINWESRVNLISTTLPGRVGWIDPDGYGVIMDPPPTFPDSGLASFAAVLAADYIDYDANWTRAKSDAPNTLLVTNSNTDDARTWAVVKSSNRRAGEAVVSAQIEAPYGVSWPAKFLGEMYLRDDSQAGAQAWKADTFTWYASRDPRWPIVRSFVPDILFPYSTWPGIAAPVVIDGIPAEQLPGTSDTGWYVGVLIGATITIHGGEIDADVTLLPLVPHPPPRDEYDDGGFTYSDWDAVPEQAGHPKTWAEAAPQSWLDFRLARPASADYPAA